jgi:hypothetical protein
MTASDDAFTRATHLVADFDSPFYDEERQRDVWNEASAIGFQTMTWGALALAGAMAWIGGGPQIGWAAGLLAVNLEDALPSSSVSSSFAGGFKVGMAIGLIGLIVALVVRARGRRGQTRE